ncbi:MAG TPA: potassium transporter Kup [Azospirillaceae bacterium]|nr:potassium transporter Kup [Azospirillaceae bacterium]
MTATNLASHGAASAAPRGSSFGTLFISAIGIVFGDIGTSPLYAMKETFAGAHPLALDRLHVLGVLSLVFWSLLLIVSVKYVAIIMRADNRGEGGSLSLLALLQRAVAGRPGLLAFTGALGIFAAALFYGDSMITPAISVLSAVEGLQVAKPALAGYVIPITIAVLVLLFAIQSKGSRVVGGLFGPVMVVWFGVLAVLGIRNIGQAPEVLLAVSPHYALAFIWHDGWTGFLALGSVVLAVTGAEALYADMGHFGKLPIRIAWYLLVWPALLLNYLGQGALLLAHPDAVESPFFRLAPDWAVLPLVILATFATVIASQAVISGAFSVTRQAIQLGYLPRMGIVHTSEHEIGQIYMPFVNWTLMLLVVGLVLGFGSSTDLAAAYGVAVTGTMIITSVLISLVMFQLWGWRNRWAMALCALFIGVDFCFFLATATKIPYGGWFPLVVAVGAYLMLTSWKMGRRLVLAKLARDGLPVETFLTSLSDRAVRVPGTAVFLTAAREEVPMSLLHNLKHNHVLHERVVILTVVVEETPRVQPSCRVKSQKLRDDFFRVTVHYGFMEDPDIPKALANARLAELGFDYEPMRISYFLNRETVIAARDCAMPLWREQLFAFLSRTATTTADFFHLPINRVVELGGHIEI